METKGKTIRCKGAVSWKQGEALVIEDINVAPPQQWEVRIKIICTSLCHSDVTFWRDLPEPLAAFPRIFGHEAVGIVESVGDHVREFKEGDMVVPVFLPACEDCVDCKSEKSNLCSKVPFMYARKGMPRDNSSRFSTIKGETLHHFLCVSSFAEYTVVDSAQVVKVDPDIPPEKYCLLSCGVSTGIGAAWRAAGVEKGSKVAIFGLGSIGLAVAEGARLRRAARIIGVDLNPDKFEIGKKFGLTDFINPRDCGDKSVSEVIAEMTEGGADYCFECVGIASLMAEALKSSRLIYGSFGLDSRGRSIRRIRDQCLGHENLGWGKTIILGVEMKGAPLSVSTGELMKGRSIIGSLFGGTKAKSDIPLFANMYKKKELQLDPFITHEVNLHEINKAFDLLLEGKSLRCIIWMDNQKNNNS